MQGVLHSANNSPTPKTLPRCTPETSHRGLCVSNSSQQRSTASHTASSSFSRCCSRVLRQSNLSKHSLSNASPRPCSNACLTSCVRSPQCAKPLGSVRSKARLSYGSFNPQDTRAYDCTPPCRSSGWRSCSPLRATRASRTLQALHTPLSTAAVVSCWRIAYKHDYSQERLPRLNADNHNHVHAHIGSRLTCRRRSCTLLLRLHA